MTSRFLLPVLQIRTVLEARTPRDRREALDTLPPNLEEAFAITIQRIQKQPTAWVKQATKVLTWIHLAERPLSVDELLEAYAIREGDTDLDRSGLLSRNTFLACCLGLATVEKETSTVRLVHFSLQEYFKNKGQILDQPTQLGHQNMARACLTYLMFRSLTTNTHSQITVGSDQEIDSEQDELGTSTSLYALLDYAACQWGHHVRKSGCLQGPTIEIAIKYLRMDLHIRMRSHSHLGFHLGGRKAKSFSTVHIGAYFGIHQVLLELFKTSTEFDLQDGGGRTPLSWAAEYGYKAVVKLLLEHGANVDLLDRYGGTPLSWASKNGYEAVVKILLEHGAKVDLQDDSNWTPLSLAAKYRHKAVVKLLLEHGANVDLLDRYG